MCNILSDSHKKTHVSVLIKTLSLLVRQIFTGDDAKTKVDVGTETETAAGGATSAVFTVRLPLVPARPALYSLLVKPARPTPPSASDPGDGTDSASHNHHSPGGAQVSHSVGRFAVVLCLCATVMFLW